MLENDEKFLFFFEPVILEENKFLFGFSLKSGVVIFSLIMAIQSFNFFCDIFSLFSFLYFLFSILSFIFHFLAAFYSFRSVKNNSYQDAKVSYLIASFIFIITTMYYLYKSLSKILLFMTPFKTGFLDLYSLIPILGYVVFLLFYLYFIYILYLYMIQLKNPEEFENKKFESKIKSKLEDLKDSVVGIFEKIEDKFRNLNLNDLTS